MAIKKKIIRVPVGKAREIAKLHKCTEQSVYNALSFTTNSEMAAIIREQAIRDYGGVLTNKIVF